VIFIKTQNFIKRNKKYLAVSIYILIIIMISIIFYKSISDININNIFTSTINILSPFITGMIIAYILNASMRFIENNIYSSFKKLKNNKSLKRGLSIGTTYILLFICIFIAIAYLIPEIFISLQNIIIFFKNLDMSKIEDTFYNKVSSVELLNQFSSEISSSIIKTIDSFLGIILDSAKYIPDMLNTIITNTMGIASHLLDFVLGMVIAFYMLLDKEKIGVLCKKILYIIFSIEVADKIIEIAKTSNSVFEKFFIGKAIDSVIIGFIFFLGAIILKLPYSLLLSIIIGVTNMIPYFGPFIGAVPVTFIVILTSPIKGLWVIIFIFVLQQFDGIFLGPKILGNSIGLQPIGVIFAILIGGAMFGALGMFFGVPIFAVIVTMFKKFIERKYTEKMNVEDKDEFTDKS